MKRFWVAATILSAYVGRNSGDQILRGKIHRGDGEEIEAAILFTDLIDFTALSDSLSGPETVALLNDVFDVMVPPVAGHGGEILKFLGDGFFAIFPYKGDELSRSFRAASEAVSFGNPRRQVSLRQYWRSKPARFHRDRAASQLCRAPACRRINPSRQPCRLRARRPASVHPRQAAAKPGVQGVLRVAACLCVLNLEGELLLLRPFT